MHKYANAGYFDECRKTFILLAKSGSIELKKDPQRELEFGSCLTTSRLACRRNHLRLKRYERRIRIARCSGIMEGGSNQKPRPSVLCLGIKNMSVFRVLSFGGFASSFFGGSGCSF